MKVCKRVMRNVDAHWATLPRIAGNCGRDYGVCEYDCRLVESRHDETFRLPAVKQQEYIRPLCSSHKVN